MRKSSMFLRFRRSMKTRFWNPFHAPAAWLWLTRIPPRPPWPVTLRLALLTKDSTIWTLRLKRLLPPTLLFPLPQFWRLITRLARPRSSPQSTLNLEREPDAGGASYRHAQHGNVHGRRCIDILVASRGFASNPRLFR